MPDQLVDATIVAAPKQRNTKVDPAIPAFGCQNHTSTDRRHRLIRRWFTTDAAAHEGSWLGDLLDPDNTAATVWVDSG